MIDDKLKALHEDMENIIFLEKLDNPMQLVNHGLERMDVLVYLASNGIKLYAAELGISLKEEDVDAYLKEHSLDCLDENNISVTRH